MRRFVVLLKGLPLRMPLLAAPQRVASAPVVEAKRTRTVSPFQALTMTKGA